RSAEEEANSMSKNPVEQLAGSTVASDEGYVLGHSQQEFRRLEQQAAYFRDLTEDLLRRAGIIAGMRVLDLGSGVGDISLLAAEFVGTSGSVLGIERSPEAVETATKRASLAGLAQIKFMTGEIDDFSSDERFDAMIGRFVLMYLPDPAATLRRIA